MANDYKAASPPRASSARSGGGRSMNPMFLGVIIGLLLGIVLALGIAIWLNRSSSPFQEKAKPVDALPTIAARPGVLQAPNTGAKDGSEKPRFEFYDILPGEKGAKADKGGAHEKILQPATKPIDATAKSTQDPKREAPVAHLRGQEPRPRDHAHHPRVRHVIAEPELPAPNRPGGEAAPQRFRLRQA